MSTSQSGVSAENAAWYSALDGQQWRTLIASNLGWLFDGFEIFALFITVGFALLSWVFLVAPNIHLSGLSLLAKLVSVAYPLGDILLLAAMIRLAVDAGRRTASFYLLVASTVALLATDCAYNYALLAGTYHHQLIYDVGWIAYLVLWGAAALHPSMRVVSLGKSIKCPLPSSNTWNEKRSRP